MSGTWYEPYVNVGLKPGDDYVTGRGWAGTRSVALGQGRDMVWLSKDYGSSVANPSSALLDAQPGGEREAQQSAPSALEDESRLHFDTCQADNPGAWGFLKGK